jgi:O-antigen ligase
VARIQKNLTFTILEEGLFIASILLFSTPLYLEPLIHKDAFLLEFIVLGLLAFSFFRSFASSPGKSSRAGLFALAFLLARLVSALVSSDVGASLTEFLNLCGGVALFVIASGFVWSSERIRRVVNLLLITSAVAGVLGVVQLLRGPAWTTQFVSTKLGLAIYGAWAQQVIHSGVALYWDPEVAGGLVRSVGTFFYGSPYCMFLAFPLCISFLLFDSEKSLKRKVLYGGSALLFTINVIFSQSRGGWLGLLLVLFIFIVTRPNKVKALGILLICLFLLLLGGGLFYSLIPSDLRARIEDLAVTHSASFIRLGLWKEYAAAIKDHLLFGVGYNKSLLVSQMLVPGATSTTPSAGHSHNLFVQMTYIGGLISLIPLLGVIVTWLGSLSILVKRANVGFEKAVAGGLLGGAAWYLLQSMFEYPFNYPQTLNLFWFFAGLTSAWAVQLLYPAMEAHPVSQSRAVAVSPALFTGAFGIVFAMLIVYSKSIFLPFSIGTAGLVAFLLFWNNSTFALNR